MDLKRLERLGVNLNKIELIKEPSFYYNKERNEITNDVNDTHVVVANYILTDSIAIDSIVDIINSSIKTYVYKIEQDVWQIWINK